MEISYEMVLVLSIQKFDQENMELRFFVKNSYDCLKGRIGKLDRQQIVTSGFLGLNNIFLFDSSGVGNHS